FETVSVRLPGNGQLEGEPPNVVPQVFRGSAAQKRSTQAAVDADPALARVGVPLIEDDLRRPQFVRGQVDREGHLEARALREVTRGVEQPLDAGPVTELLGE